MENFINRSNKKDSTYYFIVPDPEKFFKKNLKKLPADWIYRNKEILYSYNTQGFRDKSFDKINWKESVVIFGCSNVEGVGLAEEDTISRQLEKIIKRPVINLGIGGSGIDVACWNSTILYEYYDKPKAIVHIWSSLDRYADKSKYDGIIRTYMPGIKRDYDTKLNWEFRSIRYVETDRVLWKNKTIYYEASFFSHTAQVLGIDFYKCVDVARDLMHPGIESAKAAAEKIAENLTKQGL